MDKCVHEIVYLACNENCRGKSRVCREKCNSGSHRGCYENLVEIKDLQTQYRLKIQKLKDEFFKFRNEIKNFAKNKVQEIEQNKNMTLKYLQDIEKNSYEELYKKSKCTAELLSVFENGRYDYLTCEKTHKIRQFIRLNPLTHYKKAVDECSRFQKSIFVKKNVNKDKNIELRKREELEDLLQKYKTIIETLEEKVKDLMDTNQKLQQKAAIYGERLFNLQGRVKREQQLYKGANQSEPISIE